MDFGIPSRAGHRIPADAQRGAKDRCHALSAVREKWSRDPSFSLPNIRELTADDQDRESERNSEPDERSLLQMSTSSCPALLPGGPDSERQALFHGPGSTYQVLATEPIPRTQKAPKMTICGWPAVAHRGRLRCSSHPSDSSIKGRIRASPREVLEDVENAGEDFL